MYRFIEQLKLVFLTTQLDNNDQMHSKPYSRRHLIIMLENTNKTFFFPEKLICRTVYETAPKVGIKISTTENNGTNIQKLVTNRTLLLTYKGPRSQLWATGAMINQISIATQAFRLREKITIKRISIHRTKNQNAISQFIH